MPTFDGDNLIITLDSGIRNVDVEADLYSEWKEWVLLSTNSKYPPAFRTSGGDLLTPGINAGAYFFLRNDLGWRIKPPEENISIFVVGNLAPEDSQVEVLIPTVGTFTTAIFGLQPITQAVEEILESQQESLYQGYVWIDTIGGVSGTNYPVGTASEPVNNFPDALTIATTYGIRSFKLIGSITLNQPMPFRVFEGQGGLAEINVNGQDISGTSFSQVGIAGAFPSGMIVYPLFFRCKINDGVTNFVGTGQQLLFAGNISIGMPVGSDPILFSEVGSRVSTVALDLQGYATNVVIRSMYGRYQLNNITNPSCQVLLDADSVYLEVTSSCSAGLLRIRGQGRFLDNSNGLTVDSEGFLDVLYVDTQLASISTLASTVIAADLLVASGSTTTEIRTAATQATGFYDGLICVITNSAGTVARTITSYNQANGAFTLDIALPFTPAENDRFVVLGQVASAAASVDNNAIAIAVWGRSILNPSAGSYGELTNKMNRKLSLHTTLLL